jgi:hypothetical protein
MSTKKVERVSPEVLKKRLIALKKLGVINKEVSARGTLTNSQKATVRRNWKKYHEIVTAPQGSYVKKDISHYDSKEKKALANSGYTIIGDKIFIDKQGSEKAVVKRISSRIKKAGDKKEHYETYIVVDRTDKSGRKTEREFIGTALQKEGWRANLLSQYQAGEFKKGDYIGVKIGDGGIFDRHIYHSIDKIFAYLEADFLPRDAGSDKGYLLTKMHLVKMSVKDYRDLASTEKTKKQKNQERYQRSKKAKQLGVVKTKAKPKNKLVGKPRRK